MSRPGSRCRPGSLSPTVTRRSRPMPSGSSPAAWAQPTVEVPTDHVAMVSHPERGGEPHHDRRPSRAGRNLNEMSPAQLQPETSPSINPLPMKRTHGRSIMTKVVVIGGTGLIGSKVVARLPSSR